MWMIILILGLVGAGIYTDNSGFYVAAGVVGAVMVLTMLVAVAGVRAISKKMDKEFKSFDNRWKRF